VGLLDGALKPTGQSGELPGPQVAKWVQSLRWADLQERVPAARAGEAGQWWVAIPIQQSDGAAARRLLRHPAPAFRSHSALAPGRRPGVALEAPARLRASGSGGGGADTNEGAEPHRTDRGIGMAVPGLGNLKGAVDDQRVIEELLSRPRPPGVRAGRPLHSRQAHDLKHAPDAAAGSVLLEAWTQTQQHLITWVQRQNRPLLVNKVGSGSNHLTRCKVLCVPVVRDSGRVIGALAFYKLPTMPDFLARHVFLARHIGRQAASLVEAQST